MLIAGVGVVGVFKLALWVAQSAGRCGAHGERASSLRQDPSFPNIRHISHNSCVMVQSTGQQLLLGVQIVVRQQCGHSQVYEPRAASLGCCATAAATCVARQAGMKLVKAPEDQSMAAAQSE